MRVGDRVQARWYTQNKECWKFGEVVQKLGRLHYLIKLDDGYTLKRHIDQLLPSAVKSKNSLEIPTNYDDNRQDMQTEFVQQDGLFLTTQPNRENYSLAESDSEGTIDGKRQPQEGDLEGPNLEDGRQEVPEETPTPSQHHEGPPAETESRRPKRTIRLPARLNDYLCY